MGACNFCFPSFKVFFNVPASSRLLLKLFGPFSLKEAKCGVKHLTHKYIYAVWKALDNQCNLWNTSIIVLEQEQVWYHSFEQEKLVVSGTKGSTVNPQRFQLFQEKMGSITQRCGCYSELQRCEPLGRFVGTPTPETFQIYFLSNVISCILTVCLSYIVYESAQLAVFCGMVLHRSPKKHIR